MFRTKVMLSKKQKVQPVEDVPCSYSERVCMRDRLRGYDYCERHILEDKNAPYRQCSYVYPKNGKRCPNACLKGDRKDGYCTLHIKKGAFSRTRMFRKKKPVETPENILGELEHYNVGPDLHLRGGDSKELPPSVLARLPLNAPQNRASKIIDYGSDSDSGLEPVTADQAFRGNLDSEAESIDSEYEDPLKHAGVYTAEEVALITRDKLIRLQSLYIEQFKRLQHVLREKRRKYLHAIKSEKESQGSIHASARMTPEEANDYRRLKALHRYRRFYGVERLLHQQSKERRKMVTEGSLYKAPAHAKCMHPLGDKKCGQRALPFTKYCTKHILDDSRQLLYRHCGHENEPCVTPVIPVVDFGSNCILHAALPPMPSPREILPPDEGSTMLGEQLDSMAHAADDTCGLQGVDLGLSSSADMYGDPASCPGDISDLGAGLSAAQKEIWTQCLETPESKLREELESMDLTPGELPPEQLLATN